MKYKVVHHGLDVTDQLLYAFMKVFPVFNLFLFEPSLVCQHGVICTGVFGGVSLPVIITLSAFYGGRGFNLLFRYYL